MESAPLLEGSNRTHKRCPRCCEIKSLDEFRKRKDGRTPQSYCKPCSTKATVMWARENSERHRSNTANWRVNNYERYREARSQWVEDNLEKVRDCARRYYHRNAEARRGARRKYVADPANRHRIREYENRRRRENLNARIAHVLRSRLNDALKRRPKNGSAITLLGCSVDAAIAHLESMFSDGMSWANYGEWHIDHIRPLASFDLTDPKQLSTACHYKNLQPLWGSENQSKGARWNRG